MKKLTSPLDLRKIDLKVTPQRIAVLEALNTLRNHPTAEKIKEYVVKKNPNIAVGTIYNILETFVEKGLVKKVKTEKDIMRYDAILENHHHLYDEETEVIEDFFDDDLNKILEDYFSRKRIPNFRIKEIKLQINGVFKNQKRLSKS
jgi:Fur family transcriptional regulator, peroxide stress response regulator